MCSGPHMLRKSASRQHSHKAQRTERATRSLRIISNKKALARDKRTQRGVEAVGRKGRGSDDEFEGTQLPKSKASDRKEVDSEECHSAVEADLLTAKKGTQIQGNV
ncbi:hypothetical protein BHM03_00021905 [Ensete ventricosum]|nr:hypothetical protein BHM03_00021905 [Ensete ventricosum]